MIEFPSNDASASAQFFEKAFDMGYLTYGSQYTDVQLGAEQTFGFQGDSSESTNAPLVVLEVDDLDTARGRIESAGGTITVEPFEFPGGRRMHFLEPGGNELAVWVRA